MERRISVYANICWKETIKPLDPIFLGDLLDNDNDAYLALQGKFVVSPNLVKENVQSTIRQESDGYNSDFYQSSPVLSQPLTITQTARMWFSLAHALEAQTGISLGSYDVFGQTASGYINLSGPAAFSLILTDRNASSVSVPDAQALVLSLTILIIPLSFYIKSMYSQWSQAMIESISKFIGPTQKSVANSSKLDALHSPMTCVSSGTYSELYSTLNTAKQAFNFNSVCLESAIEAVRHDLATVQLESSPFDSLSHPTHFTNPKPTSCNSHNLSDGKDPFQFGNLSSVISNISINSREPIKTGEPLTVRVPISKGCSDTFVLNSDQSQIALTTVTTRPSLEQAISNPLAKAGREHTMNQNTSSPPSKVEGQDCQNLASYSMSLAIFNHMVPGFPNSDASNKPTSSPSEQFIFQRSAESAPSVCNASTTQVAEPKPATLESKEFFAPWAKEDLPMSALTKAGLTNEDEDCIATPNGISVFVRSCFADNSTEEWIECNHSNGNP